MDSAASAIAGECKLTTKVPPPQEPWHFLTVRTMGIEHRRRLLTRRQFAMLMGGLAVVPVFPGCRARFQSISVAAHVWPGYEPMFLARSEGWLDAKQASLIETRSATESLQALAAGKVDGAALTLDEVLRARAKGIPLAVLMVFDVSAGADMLVARPGIKKLVDLKGKRIAYEQGASGALMLSEALSAANLNRDEVKPVALPVDQQYAAWQQGQIDAAITYEPVASQLLALDAVKLFDSRQIPEAIIDVLALRSDVLDPVHASAIRHLISAHLKALAHLHRNPQDASYRMAARMGLPADKVLASFRGLVLPNAVNNRRMLTTAASQFSDSARKLSRLMVKEGILQHEDPLTELIRAEYLPAAD